MNRSINTLKSYRVLVEVVEFRDSVPIKYWHTTLADSQFEAVENAKERHHRAYSIKIVEVML